MKEEGFLGVSGLGGGVGVFVVIIVIEKFLIKFNIFWRAYQIRDREQIFFEFL
jgi:hypothetical protein